MYSALLVVVAGLERDGPAVGLDVRLMVPPAIEVNHPLPLNVINYVLGHIR